MVRAMLGEWKWPMSATFAEVRREVQDAERRVADARVQAMEARREVRMTRLAAPPPIDT
jgi:hypothetical protein